MDLTNFIGMRENTCTCTDAYMDPQLGVMFVFQCDCGNIYKERYKSWLSKCRVCNPIKRSPSPPSLRLKFKREFNSWSDMMSRCYKPSHRKYHRYGGRGISVCDRWHKFPNFLEDMGERPPNTTIDRIDNDGNYHLVNCRWADPTKQANNTCNQREITIDGQRMPVTSWAWRYGLTRMLINRRFENGWQSQDLLKPAIFGWRFLLPHYKD